MKVWRELTLDFFFLWGVFFAFRGVCYLDKGVFFDLGGVLYFLGDAFLLLRGSINTWLIAQAEWCIKYKYDKVKSEIKLKN